MFEAVALGLAELRRFGATPSSQQGGPVIQVEVLESACTLHKVPYHKFREWLDVEPRSESEREQKKRLRTIAGR